MISKNNAKQFVKFALVGILSTAVNYSVFYVLYMYGHINYMVASAIGFIVGVFIGFLLNKSWTFMKDAKADSFMLKYFAIYVISLCMSLLFLKLAVTNFNVDARLANIISIGFTTIINFLGTKLLVFKA